MVSDRHVLVATIAGRLGHLFNRVAAVGFDGVHVDVALQVSLGDQHGQRVVFGGVDLAEVLTQLGGNVIQFELCVNLFFSLARDRLFRVELGQTVFTQGVAHFERALTQSDIVGLGSREVLHRRTPTIGGHQP